MHEKPQEETAPKKSVLRRIDRHYISHEIEHVLHLDKGIFFTIKELLVRPGKTIREFLFEDREKYVKPILFLIITSIIFTLLIHIINANIVLFNIDGGTFKDRIRSKEIAEWTSNNTGYAQLIMGVFITVWIKIFFRKFKYNIYEIIVLMSFILGEALLVLGFFAITSKIFGYELIFTLGKGFYFFYIIWAIGQFFGEKKFLNYLKSTLSFALGVLTYMATLTILAYLLKHFL